jgi:hypothetical protein
MSRGGMPHGGILPPMRSVVVGGVVLLALAGCGGTSSSTVSLPPAGASASVVLDTYLRALVAGDCTTAHALAASTFTVGNGELCGDVRVSAFTAPTGPATPGHNTVEYASDLTTDGSSDGSIPSGKTTWFYQLRQQDGDWKLVSGGSGP